MTLLHVFWLLWLLVRSKIRGWFDAQAELDALRNANMALESHNVVLAHGSKHWREIAQRRVVKAHNKSQTLRALRRNIAKAAAKAGEHQRIKAYYDGIHEGRTARQKDVDAARSDGRRDVVWLLNGEGGDVTTWSSYDRDLLTVALRAHMEAMLARPQEVIAGILGAFPQEPAATEPEAPSGCPACDDPYAPINVCECSEPPSSCPCGAAPAGMHADCEGAHLDPIDPEDTEPSGVRVDNDGFPLAQADGHPGAP